MIDGAPKVVRFAIDLNEDLIEMPAPAGKISVVDATFSSLGREHQAETLTFICSQSARLR